MIFFPDSLPKTVPRREREREPIEAIIWPWLAQFYLFLSFNSENFTTLTVLSVCAWRCHEVYSSSPIVFLAVSLLSMRLRRIDGLFYRRVTEKGTRLTRDDFSSSLTWCCGRDPVTWCVCVETVNEGRWFYIYIYPFRSTRFVYKIDSVDLYADSYAELCEFFSRILLMYFLW